MAVDSAVADKRIGLSIVLAIGVVLGAGAMLLAPGEAIGATGFALAIVAGLLLITAVHLVDP